MDGRGRDRRKRFNVSAFTPIEKFFRRKLSDLLRGFDLRLVRDSKVKDLLMQEKELAGLRVLLSGDGSSLDDMQRLLASSKSQIFQDLFVLSQLGFRRNGYFVEFGATNGIDLSNSCLLEKEYGWNGVLAEPARCWHEALRKNRSSVVDTRCVWGTSGEWLDFNEVEGAELSTINSYSNSDHHAKARARGLLYKVETVSLNDLLIQHGAPQLIDYLSIDTEGSEFDILSKLDYNKFNFRVITAEHNYGPGREKLLKLLESHKYRRVLPDFSRFEDWYLFDVASLSP